MIEILVAIIFTFGFSIFLISYSDSGNSVIHAILGFTGFVSSIFTVVFSLLYIVLIWNWVASEHKANIINREYGTSYTRTEVFYASDVIDIVRELDRKRYEVNGDIAKPKKERK